MKLRVARHTSQLPEIVSFYKNIIGLQELASFNDHEGYNGVFLGLAGLGWHLEFTTSESVPERTSDEDDFLVFYVDTKAEQNAIRNKCIEAGVPILTAKNPYWNKDGLVISDPDEIKLIIAISR